MKTPYSIVLGVLFTFTLVFTAAMVTQAIDFDWIHYCTRCCTVYCPPPYEHLIDHEGHWVDTGFGGKGFCTSDYDACSGGGLMGHVLCPHEATLGCPE